MNKYIITNKQLSLLRESVKIENVKLPDFIADSIRQHKTSLGKHPSFPPDTNMSFEEKIMKKRYYELLSNIKKVDGINGDISKRNLMSILEDMVVKCKKIEEPIKDKLEKICYEFSFDLFGIKYGDIDLECSITNDIKLKQPIVPVMLDDSFFEDTKHIDNLTGEIMKRRLINALIQGACVRLSTNYETILNKIYTLDQRLPELYYNINAINEYLSFVKERKPNTNNIGGVVSVDLTKDEPVIKSEGIIFPSLLFETFKGLMELFSSHGLPSDRGEAEYIISQSDFLLAENWDKRFGVGMWDILMDTIGVENIIMLPHMFVELVSLPSSDFSSLMREVFARTKRGNEIISSIKNSISKSIKFGEIDDTLTDYTTEDNEYFTPEELIANDNQLTETNTASVGDYSYDSPMFLDDETADRSNMISNSRLK